MAKRNFTQIIRQKSAREIFFRIGLIIRGKCGLLKYQFPVFPKQTHLVTLPEFRKNRVNYLFANRASINFRKLPDSNLEKFVNRILAGEFQFFNKEWRKLGSDYDWVTNPVTSYRYDKSQFWNSIESLDAKAGDIKYVWEKSRFSWLYHIIRFDYHFDRDHSNYVFDNIIDWIDHNPINCGPNFKCSQEISLRVLNWIFALFFYRQSQNLTEERWEKIIHSIYWQIRHVYSNINFSRIAVRNNHAITETLTLYIVGLLFPELPQANKWKHKGKRWFEEEIKYQFESDGSYLQQSMNYQRVVTQLLTLAISLAEVNGETFSEVVYENAYKSLDFLYQCQDDISGWLPNYGANDGALFFPLSNVDYRDYTPQLDALHFVLTGAHLYNNPLEDSYWFGVSTHRFPPLSKKTGLIEFPKGGYYLFREKDTLTFIRCGTFKGKGTTDQLHLDVWYKGKNVLFDGGSFRYNSSVEDIKYFSGTESHNTIMIDEYDQMLKGPRFMWFYPPTIKNIKFSETPTEYIFIGEVEMFKAIASEIVVRRKVIKQKNLPKWTIIDQINNLPKGLTMRQLWHLDDANVEILASGLNTEREEKSVYKSDYYGTKDNCMQIEYITQSKEISTNITI